MNRLFNSRLENLPDTEAEQKRLLDLIGPCEIFCMAGAKKGTFEATAMTTKCIGYSTFYCVSERKAIIEALFDLAKDMGLKP